MIRRAIRRLLRAGGRRPSDAASSGSTGDLQRRAATLSQTVFLGGPVKHFERYGRLQFIALIRRGLTSDAYVLDVGCGALRAGYWLIHFLDPGRYHGIEPNREMLEAARRTLLEPGLEESRQPRYAHNDDFDLSVFGISPRFVLARSIWTHASKEQIERMLESYASIAPADGLLLASYLPSGRLWGRPSGQAGWVGRGPESDVAGLVRHHLGWIAATCRRHDLTVRESHVDRFGQQTWLEIRRASYHGGSE